MKAQVYVRLKPGVLDPQGKAIGNALASLGFAGIGEVRQGKLIELDLVETDLGLCDRACPFAIGGWLWRASFISDRLEPPRAAEYLRSAVNESRRRHLPGLKP
jgi:phosphoribosylformylglycinamidine synthase PurS subunit